MSDLISRQAAIELVDWYQHEFSECDYAFGELANELSKLPSAEPEACKYWDAESKYCALNRPSAQPERKMGRFIGTEYDGYADGNPVYYEWKCSCCGAIFEGDEPTYNYCPNCGAEMVKGETE